MENALHVIAIWLHVLGIALFVGPQFFLVLAWLPASRAIDDLPTRVAAMRVITTRFGYIGAAGMALIFVGGAYLIATWRSYHDTIIGDNVGFLDVAYGPIFIIKMSILMVMLLLTGLHMFVIGPAQIDALEERARGGDVPDLRLRRLRIASISLSGTGLLLTLVIMALGAGLGSEYATRP